MQNLVSFPPPASPGCGYEDGHEGLQVYLVVPQPTESDSNGSMFECFTQPLTLMARPDVPLTETELWDSYVEERIQRKRRDGARRVLEQHGTETDQEALRESVPSATFSLPVLASVLVGTRFEAVTYPDGHMWQAKDIDLTHDGKVLYDTLAAVYGIEPVLITTLET